MRRIDRREDWSGPGRPLTVALPLLEERLRQQILDVSLLARSVHAVEYAVPAPRLLRRRHLLRLASVLASGSVREAEVYAREVRRGSACVHCSTLIAHLPALMSSLHAWPTALALRIREIAADIADRNAAFALRARPDGAIPLQSLAELIAYCDANSGLLAQSITELLFAHDTATYRVAERLRQLAPEGGQGVQLVAILAATGRSPSVPGFVTGDVDLRQAVLASEVRLRRAELYVDALRAASAQRAIVAFASLPVVWARTELNTLLVNMGLTPSDEPLIDTDQPSWRKVAAAPS